MLLDFLLDLFLDFYRLLLDHIDSIRYLLSQIRDTFGFYQKLSVAFLGLFQNGADFVSRLIRFLSVAFSVDSDINLIK